MSSDPAFSRAGQHNGSGGPNGEPDEPPADEPRTETTLTTRISINIPGSRPIPPVVVRSAMPGAGGGSTASGTADEPQAAGARHRSGSGSSPVLGVMDSANGSAAMPDLPPEWRTQGQGSPIAPATGGAGAAAEAASPDEGEAPSTWFAPRRKGPATEAQPEAQTPAQAPARTQAQAQTPTQGPPRSQAPATPTPEPFAFDQQQSPPQAFQQQPQTPDYGRQDRQDYGRPDFGRPSYDQPGYDQSGYGSQDQAQPVYQQQPYGGPQSQTQAPPARPAPGNASGNGSGRPPGMNGGLVVGAPDTRPGPAADVLDPTVALPMFQGAGSAAPAQAGPNPAAPPAAPAARPAARPASPPKRPQQPQQSQRGDRPAPAGPPVSDGFAGGTGGAGAAPRKETAEAAPAAAAARATPARGSRRGRKLLVSSTALLVLAAGVVYGAGLMLNQGDVPKGTTVLGASIGGDTQDAAVHTLDGTVGVLAAKPLQLVIGSRNVELNPSVAGLTIDTTATVQGVAHHDYNPVAVVGSLFGGDHAVTPVVKIDQAKLHSALQQLAAGGAGAAREGSIHFTADGSIVKTLPQAGQSINVNTAMSMVQLAYENRAIGLADRPIILPESVTQPQTTAAEVDAAADSIGKRATKNTFTVKVHGVSQQFGKITFSKALTLQPNAAGKLVPVFDLVKLQSLYGTRFDNLKIKHNGVSGPVTPQDIAAALTTLLEAPQASSTTASL
jgi:hypothetical protein